MEVLFRTVHGSHLYGMAHAGSDLDYYEVIPNKGRERKRYAKQSIKDGIDRTIVDFSTFRQFCDDGVPQALEACFAPAPEVDHISDFRAAYRVDTARMVARYRRTIKSFSVGNAKQRRHALRLMINLDEAVITGRFNPVLSKPVIEAITRLAALEEETYFHYVDNYLAQEYDA